MSMYVVCLQTVCELGGFQMIRPPLKDKEAGVVKVYIYIYNTNKEAICILHVSTGFFRRFSNATG